MAEHATIEHSEHDHGACARDALAYAEVVCAAGGLRFTEQRRRVLAALAQSHVPASAYEVIDRLADADGRRPAPISVYRALDFLTGHGLAHRIESKNAFVACTRAGSHDHAPDAAGGTATVFLLCERCGAAAEAASPALDAAVARLAAEAGFTPHARVIELRGLCPRCTR